MNDGFHPGMQFGGTDVPQPDFDDGVRFGEPAVMPPLPIVGDDVPASELSPPEPPAPQEDDGEVDEFPAQHADDVIGLAFLGALSTSFELLGHRFVMRTYKVGEELAAAQIVKEYEGTLGQGKAYAMAQVAASIVTVDGRPLVEALGPDDTVASMRRSFEFIRQNWYWPVIEALYREYSALMLRQAAAFEALEGKSLAGRLTSLPYAGSQIVKGF